MSIRSTATLADYPVGTRLRDHGGVLHHVRGHVDDNVIVRWWSPRHGGQWMYEARPVELMPIVFLPDGPGGGE